MARPLRIEYPGAIYHVMNRGNQRQDVFRRKADGETFVEKLEYFSALFNIEIYCYVLMNNHFHLLLRTEEANLGRFMQSFLTSFTVTLNRRNQKSGHLFQGRYKAQLIESQGYISKLSRYIHLNPVRVEKYQDISMKRNILLNYTWSSFASHIGLKEPEDFLDIKPVLSTWGSNNIIRMKNYRAYVEEGLYKDIDNPFELAIRQQIIGSETFAERITRTRILKRKVKDRREESALCAFQKSLNPDGIVNAIAEYFEISRETILQRRSKEKMPRQIAMYLCAVYCCSRVSMNDLGKLFSVSLSGITIARDRIREKMSTEKDKVLIKAVNEIKMSTV